MRSSIWPALPICIPWPGREIVEDAIKVLVGRFARREGFNVAQAALKCPAQPEANGAVDGGEICHGSIEPVNGFCQIWMVFASHEAPRHSRKAGVHRLTEN
ncbi:MAG: hypothetical protein B7Y80_03045 [Hyphomicrobium sp. 32-62-53]|nr:MAG: hypothetical protein B7Y80_03045 [Hyphomicrobium sp. 32-62-53]